MTGPGYSSRLSGILRRFHRGVDGVAMVEFAMVLPVMLLLYIGGVAITQGIMTDRKVILLSGALADLVARGTALSEADAKEIFAAATAVVAPYSVDKKILRMNVSSIRINNKGKACVVWSLSYDAAPGSTPPAARNTSSPLLLASGSDADALVPADLRSSSAYSSSLIRSKVEYDYKPIVGDNIVPYLFPIKLGEVFFTKPRRSAEVTSFSETRPSTTVCKDS